MNSPRTGIILGLDGLRTIALFGVLFFHMFPNAVSGGYFGVILFFVILDEASILKGWVLTDPNFGV